MNKRKGFTLIEVLIVVIILGILATLAIPQFGKMTKRARLAEAWAGLGAIRTGQAVYFMEQNKYTGTLTDLDVTLDATNFTYTVPIGNATAFNAVATGVATSPCDGIVAFINSAGGNGYTLGS